jgi:UDP-2,4-diacetamido-2,4,6-trideoxy-beta-L-altropyranose hydrolase
MVQQALSSRPLAVLIFRASAEIGGGHAVRCLALADALAEAGWRCRLSVTEDSVEAVPEIATSRHAKRYLARDHYPDPSAHGTDADLAELAVIDDYGLDAGFESKARRWAGGIAAIDDLANRPHDADLLLDPRPDGRQDAYDGIVPVHCRLLVGPAYALLRRGFAGLRAEALKRRRSDGPISRVLVSLGATDAADLGRRCIKAIALAQLNVPIDWAGAASRQVMDLAVRAPRLDIAFHGHCWNIEELMSRADLALGTAGVTAFERCCLGLPSVAIVAADNQRVVGESLAARGALLLAGGLDQATPERLASMLCDLAADEGMRRRMTDAASATCDGRGAVRAAEEIETIFAVRIADGPTMTGRSN